MEENSKLPTDDALQSRLEALEAGKPLPEIQDGLSNEEADLLALANELRLLAVPAPTKDAAINQRAHLERLVMANKRGAPTVATPSTTTPHWQQWLQSLSPRTRLGLALLIPLLLFALLWAWPNPASAPDIADDPPGNTSLPTAVTSDETPAEEITADQPAQNPTAAGADAVPGATTLALPNTPPGQIFGAVDLASLPTTPDTAVVQTFAGVVKIQQTDGSWQTVARAGTIATGQRLRTGKLGGAALTFHDGSVATLGANTELTIDTLDAQLSDDGFRTIVLTQWHGDSRHNVQFRSDSGSLYEVQTPDGTGIARGTVFDVIVRDGEQSRYAVTEGVVDVSAANVTVRLDAGETTTILPDDRPATARFIITGEGEVTAVGDTWTIGGQDFAVTPETILNGEPQLGDWVTVVGHLGPSGERIADQITLIQPNVGNTFKLTGLINAIAADSWTVADQTIAITTDTDLPTDAAPGDIVRVSGRITTDGTLVADIIALVNTDVEQPFEFTGVVQAIEEEAWLIAGTAVAVTVDTEIDPTVIVGDIVSVEGIILEESIWLATEIKGIAEEETTFTFSGPVESINPWVVAGINLTTADYTIIGPGIAVGDRVVVSGIVNSSGQWVAATILPADDETAVFRFVGPVTSLDPWVVNGITLPVDDDTEIDDGIEIGTLVLVEITLTESGDWQIMAIRLLNQEDISGCFTVTTILNGISGDTLYLRDWPELILSEDVTIIGDLTPNSIVTLFICATSEGEMIIVAVEVIRGPQPVDNDDGNEDDDQNGETPPADKKVTICHLPGGDDSKGRTITISEAALSAHLAHGDTMGPCP